MTPRPEIPHDDRLDALLAERALQPLSPAEERELADRLALRPDVDPDGLDRAAAALDLAMTAGSAREPLPAALRARILAKVPGAVVRPAAKLPRLRIWRSPVWAGWAAAAGLLALLAWERRPAAEPDPSDARVALLARDSSATVVPFTVPSPSPDELSAWDARAGRWRTVSWASTRPAGAAKLDGDIVWSADRRGGYLRFRGLEPNDPARAQYQLWIFAKGRDPRFPVDGGVFDIKPGPDGQAVVPIRPALDVAEPVGFAVTRERPGGVVVSDRSDLLATASFAAR